MNYSNIHLFDYQYWSREDQFLLLINVTLRPSRNSGEKDAANEREKQRLDYHFQSGNEKPALNLQTKYEILR